MLTYKWLKVNSIPKKKYSFHIIYLTRKRFPSSFAIPATTSYVEILDQ